MDGWMNWYLADHPSNVHIRLPRLLHTPTHTHARLTMAGRFRDHKTAGACAVRAISASKRHPRLLPAGISFSRMGSKQAHSLTHSMPAFRIAISLSQQLHGRSHDTRQQGRLHNHNDQFRGEGFRISSNNLKSCTALCILAGYHRLPSVQYLYVQSLVSPRPHGLVLPARADHLPVGRPVHGIDLTRSC